MSMAKNICGIEFVERSERYWDSTINDHRYIYCLEAMLPGKLLIYIDDTHVSIIDDSSDSTLFQADNIGIDAPQGPIRQALKFVASKLAIDLAKMNQIVIDSYDK